MIESITIQAKDILPGDVIDEGDHFDIVEDVVPPSTGCVLLALCSRVWITSDHLLRQQGKPINRHIGIRAEVTVRRRSQG